ncbi:hypothetical protein, partial [Xanthomonas fragariae]
VEIVSYASTLCAIGTQQARILEVWCVVQTFLSASNNAGSQPIAGTGLSAEQVAQHLQRADVR